MYAVETDSLVMKRGVKLILNDINLQIAEGEHTIVFGLNGCGKTTLLSSICGWSGFTSGEIRLFGETLTSDNAIELRSHIGFASNSYFDRIYQRENVLNIVVGAVFGELAERYEITSADIRRAKHLLKSLGLRDKAAYPYDLLSYGQRQRVLIARSLMVPPKLLVLDEPCNGLDVLTREYFLNTVSQIAAMEGTTVITATHYVEEILPFYKKGVLIKSGEIYAAGPIEEVFTSETLSDFFDHRTACSWRDGHMRFDIVNNYSIPQDTWM